MRNNKEKLYPLRIYLTCTLFYYLSSLQPLLTFKSRPSANGCKQRLNNTLNIPERVKRTILRTSEVFRFSPRGKQGTPVAAFKRLELAKNAKISVKTQKKAGQVGLLPLKVHFYRLLILRSSNAPRPKIITVAGSGDT